MIELYFKLKIIFMFISLGALIVYIIATIIDNFKR